VAALDADPSIAFVSHWLRTFGDEHADWTPTDCTFHALLDMNTVNGAALVRRQAVEAVGGFDESFTDGCEDWDFWITLVERGYAGRILPEVLFHYRRHASSMSRAMAREGRHPELYRRLVAKHAETWRAHLPTLLARRERDIGALQREIHKIDIDQHDVIDPQVQGLRDDLRAAERARERRAEAARSECVEREHQRLTGEVARLQGEVSRLASECARLGEDAARRVDDQARATQEIARRAAEVEALRESWSWRLTAPLRALLDAWLRFRRTR